MKIGQQNGTWIFIYPIKDLTLTDAVQNEVQICRVTFVKLQKFKRKTKTFGLPIYSTLAADKTIRRFFTDLQQHETLAIVRQSGELDDSSQKAERFIAEELDALALSQLYSGDIRPMLGRTVNSGVWGHVEYLAVDAKSDRRVYHGRKSPMRPLSLDEDWRAWQKDFYFPALISCLKRKNGFDKEWRGTILRAVALVAEGMTSANASFAFLHNMIALETILLKQGDSHKIALPRRLCALIGWNKAWLDEDYPGKILEIYSKRCLYVHDGDISTISAADVDFTDHLLHNVFNSILQHPKCFTNKDSLVKFTENVMAEMLLGIPAIRSKFLPKTMGLTRRG